MKVFETSNQNICNNDLLFVLPVYSKNAAQSKIWSLDNIQIPSLDGLKMENSKKILLKKEEYENQDLEDVEISTS